MKRGYGIREVLSCLNDIKEKLNDGYTISYVHRDLISSGKITIKYSHFHKLLTRMGVKPRNAQRISAILDKNILNNALSNHSPHPNSFFNKKISPEETNNLPAIRGESLPASYEEEDEDFGIIRTPRDKLF